MELLTEPASAWVGNSITNGSLAFSIADWCNFFSFGRLNHDAGYNYGVSGNKTTDVIARLGTIQAANAAFLELLIGTNDIGTGGRLASDVIPDYATIVNTMLGWSATKRIAVCTILSRSGANAINASQETQRQLLNTFIRSLPASDPRIVLVDYDASSGWDPTIHSIDGLHPNNYGAFLLGKFNASQISGILNPIDVLANYTMNNLHPNPTLAGTSGGLTGATGQVATSCQVRNFTTGITATASKGTLAGFTSEDMALNGTSTANGSCSLRGVTTVSTVVSETYMAMAHVKIAAGGNLSSLTMSFSANNMFGTGTIALPLNQDIEGVLRTGPVPIVTTQTNAAFDISASSQTGAINNQLFQVARPVIRKLS